MSSLVFLLDVDNTLLNNDDIKKDFETRLQSIVGSVIGERFWHIYEAIREEISVIDIPLTLDRLREQIPISEMDAETYERVRAIFTEYPFHKALYPHTLETLHYLRTIGLTVIVSDGDPVFQASKIRESGLVVAVEDHVLIYIHKQQHIEEMLAQYPADHYAVIDDKPQILHEMKALLGKQLTTVFVRQGKYARGPLPAGFRPDITVEQIGDLRHYTSEQFLRA